MSDKYSHGLDVTDPREPDHEAHFGDINDRTIPLPDYEAFIKERETNNKQLPECF